MSKAEVWMSYLPSYYQNIREMKTIAEVEGAELDRLAYDIEDVMNQSYPETATWALSRYEQELNVPVNLAKPVEQRRSVVISKMRGSGKVSGSMLKSVAQAYERGSIDVSVQPEEYKIKIRFVDTYGLPPNLNDLKAAIEEIKPAHLAVEYSLRYLTIAEAESMTVEKIELTTQDRFLGGGA